MVGCRISSTRVTVSHTYSTRDSGSHLVLLRVVHKLGLLLYCCIAALSVSSSRPFECHAASPRAVDSHTGLACATLHHTLPYVTLYTTEAQKVLVDALRQGRLDRSSSELRVPNFRWRVVNIRRLVLK